MGHSHGHGHGHSHDHHHTGNKKALMWAFILIASFMIVEVIGGIWTNSLALLSDAGHMLSDAAALGLSFLAIKIGKKRRQIQKHLAINDLKLLLLQLMELHCC